MHQPEKLVHFSNMLETASNIWYSNKNVTGKIRAHIIG